MKLINIVTLKCNGHSPHGTSALDLLCRANSIDTPICIFRACTYMYILYSIKVGYNLFALFQNVGSNPIPPATSPSSSTVPSSTSAGSIVIICTYVHVHVDVV